MSEVLSDEEREFRDAQGMEDDGEEEATTATQTQEEEETEGAEGDLEIKGKQQNIRA